VRSTNPSGCAVITGHGIIVEGSSAIAGAAAFFAGAATPALGAGIVARLWGAIRG
jgi:hypothetical protein